MKVISLFLYVFLSIYPGLIFGTDLEQKSFDDNAEPGTPLIAGFSSELNANETSNYAFEPIATRGYLWWWSLLGGLILAVLTTEADQAPSHNDEIIIDPSPGADDPPTIDGEPEPPISDLDVDVESSDTSTLDTPREQLNINRQGRGLFFSASKSTDQNNLLKSTSGGPIFGTISGDDYKYLLGFDEWSGDKILLGGALSLQNSETNDSRFNTESTSRGASLLTFINLLINKNIEVAGFLGHSRNKNERDVGLGVVTLESAEPTGEDIGLDVTSEGSFTEYENFVGIQSTLSKNFRNTLNISSVLALEYADIKTDGYFSRDGQNPKFGTVLPETHRSKTTLRFGISSAKIISTPYGIAVVQGGIQYLNIFNRGDSTKSISGTSVFESDTGSLVSAENPFELNDRFLPTDDSEIATGSIGLSFIYKRGFQGFARYAYSGEHEH